MTALSPLVIPALLGYLMLTSLVRSVPIRHKKLFLATASLPTGFGICSMILFISLWILPSHARLISWAVSVGTTLALGGFLLFKHFSNRQPHAVSHALPDLKIILKKSLSRILENKKSALRFTLQTMGFLVFLAALWAIIQFFTLAVSANITGGWDARYMWLLKAKFMFQSSADWQTVFSPKLSWTHPDYPLLWPGTLAWGWNCLGHESLFWPPWASLCFYVSCTLILVWYLAAHISPIAGWIAGTFFLVLTPPLFWSIQQYTDVPLTFFMTASALTLITALRSGQTRLFVVSGLMAGFAAWTKNEGLLFLIWTGILLSGMKLLKKRTSSSKIPFLKAFLLGAFLPLLWILAFKIFLGKSGDYLGSNRSALDYLTLVFSGWKNGPMILQSFWDQISGFPAWKGLWTFFLLACFVFLLKKKRNGYEGLLLTLILLLNSDYILAFLTTPNDLAWHLQTALERLLIHTAPLALAFSFETLTFRRNIAQIQ